MPKEKKTTTEKKGFLLYQHINRISVGFMALLVIYFLLYLPNFLQCNYFFKIKEDIVVKNSLFEDSFKIYKEVKIFSHTENKFLGLFFPLVKTFMNICTYQSLISKV